MIPIFAVTTRGLETIGAEEMRRLPDVQVTRVAYRRIHASCAGELAPLFTLRTVDDVFLELAAWEGIAPQRSGLAELTRLAGKLKLAPALQAIAQVRSLPAPPSFSVTANFVGKRNYSTDEIKAAVATGIASRYGWNYAEEDQGQLNLRLFIDHEQAFAGLRLGTAPLHRRPYKQANLPGSLKPAVAAAMLQIAGLLPGESVLDPFCGAGTILIEAALSGLEAYGGDNDPQALQAAQENAALAGISLSLEPWDARHLPLESRSVPCVVSNFPWGRQVEVGEELPAFYRETCAEISRVLTGNGQVVVLTNLPQLMQFPQRRIASQTEISLFGQQPSILHFTV